MNVVISPNVKKTSERIDSAGNIINKDGTIKLKEPEFVPTKEMIESAMNRNPVATESPKIEGLADKIQKMIEEKVNKIVEQKIEEALKKLMRKYFLLIPILKVVVMYDP